MGNYFKSKFAELAVKAIDSKIDGREITLKIEEQLDAQLGEKTSERIQRGAILNLLKEMIEGLFAEDPGALRVELHNWAGGLKTEVD